MHNFLSFVINLAENTARMSTIDRCLTEAGLAYTRVRNYGG
jgi:hypothetical protein